MNIFSILSLATSFVFSGILMFVMYRFLVKKKVPTVSYTPYDDAMNGEKKE